MRLALACLPNLNGAFNMSGLGGLNKSPNGVVIGLVGKAYVFVASYDAVFGLH